MKFCALNIEAVDILDISILHECQTEGKTMHDTTVTKKMPRHISESVIYQGAEQEVIKQIINQPLEAQLYPVSISKVHAQYYSNSTNFSRMNQTQLLQKSPWKL